VELLLFNHFAMNQTTAFESVGVDVSSRELHAWYRSDDQSGIHRVYENSVSGIVQMIEFLGERESQTPIVMESTGRYHYLCATMLNEKGFHVSVMNPLVVKKYQQSRIRKTKTDKIDANILAEVGAKEKCLPRFTSSREDIHIRQKISLICSLEKTLQKCSASISNYEKSLEKTGGELSEEESAVKAIIEQLHKRKDKLEREVVRLISAQPQHLESFTLLKTIPGVSPFMACLALFFYSFEKGKNSRQWVAYTGMDVSVLESGNWKGHGHLAKRGNRYLRKRWFSAAWGAMMHSDEFGDYYKRLKEEGRAHTEALNIIARKLIRITHHILKTKQPFNSGKAF
jgi:transposase